MTADYGDGHKIDSQKRDIGENTVFFRPPVEDWEWTDLLDQICLQCKQSLENKWGDELETLLPAIWGSTYDAYTARIIRALLESNVALETEKFKKTLQEEQGGYFNESLFNDARYDIAEYIVDKEKLKETIVRGNNPTLQH